MANFAPPAFGRAFTAASAAKTDKAALAENKRQAIVEAFAESLKEGRENTSARIAELRAAAVELKKKGGTDDQIETVRNSIFALAKTFGDRLDQGSAFAAQAGQSSEVPVGAGDEFVESELQLFNSEIYAAKLATPAATGAQSAEGKFAEAQRLAEALGVPVDRVAQAMGILPAAKTPVAGIGPGGLPGFFREGPAGFERVPGAAPIPSGLDFDFELTPEGGLRVTTGTKPKLQKPTLARLEKSILDSQEGLARLFQIRESFDPKFLTFGGKFENFKLMALDKVNPDSLSNEEKQFLIEYSSFTASAIENVNLHIQQLTGAQMSAEEADRLRKSMPDPERDGPTVFFAKMNTNIRQLALVRARAIHVRNQGFDKDPWAVFDLNQIDDIIEARIDHLTVEFTRQRLPGDEARRAALQQVAKEFGIE